MRMSKQQLKAKYGSEKIFAVPFSKIDFIEDRFTKVKHDSSIWRLFDTLGKFVYRYDVEGEPSMQQIVPYILILNEDEDKVFATKRIIGDARLQGKLSIAYNGHIDSSDGTREVLFKAAVRELFEAVQVDILKPFKIIGYVRDLTSLANDHTGVVIIATVTGGVTIRGDDTLIGEWMDLKGLINNYEKLESWSKYIVDYFTENKGFK